uniref:Uncharacterized protein n=1 Tax=Castor canadensis TaxID=51338 RepID=A0A8C0XN64_CASCN|nr:transmembrane protein 182-like [Castor canadensis]
MRLNIAIFFGAIFGALGVLLFLVAFGSDYWLLATEVGKCSGEQNLENVTFHHEGFFWRCWFNGILEENDSNIWKFWYTNQPPSKNCTHAYLSPYPFMRGEPNSTSYDSAVSKYPILQVPLKGTYLSSGCLLQNFCGQLKII